MEQSEIYIDQTKQFIERNLRDIKSAEEIANAMGIQYDYLRKVFRRHLGKTIWEYVEEVRIEHAK